MANSFYVPLFAVIQISCNLVRWMTSDLLLTLIFEVNFPFCLYSADFFLFGIKQIDNLICGLLTLKETCSHYKQPKAVKRLTQHCLPTLKLKTYKKLVLKKKRERENLLKDLGTRSLTFLILSNPAGSEHSRAIWAGICEPLDWGVVKVPSFWLDNVRETEEPRNRTQLQSLCSSEEVSYSSNTPTPVTGKPKATQRQHAKQETPNQYLQLPATLASQDRNLHLRPLPGSGLDQLGQQWLRRAGLEGVMHAQKMAVKPGGIAVGSPQGKWRQISTSEAPGILPWWPGGMGHQEAGGHRIWTEVVLLVLSLYLTTFLQI